jgi:DNA-binding NtrC family response regulator
MPHDPVSRPPTPVRAVVVVDDNEQIRNVVTRALKNAGYHVMDWADPRKVIEYLASSKDDIALALVDGVMPQMLGPDAAIEIERLRPGIPIMLMSGHEAPMFSEFFGQPGHHYIAKPFVIGDLVARIDTIVGKGALLR